MPAPAALLECYVEAKDLARPHLMERSKRRRVWRKSLLSERASAGR